MPVRLLTAALTTAFTIAAAAAAPATSWADPTTTFDVAPFAASKTKPLFDVAPLEAAAQMPPVTATAHNHQFGLGIRMGGVRMGVGASVRYFFGGGPLGIQGEVSRYGYDAGPIDWSSVQFAPAVMYRFRHYQFEAPLSLTPHAGGGLSIVHYGYDTSNDPLFEPFEVDDTDVGLLFFGGVELFFRNVPNLGVTGGLTVTTNGDFGPTPVGGAAFTAAGHWYFW